MERTWRWFGKNDKITLAMLKEIGVEGIVTALHDVPNGEVWTREKIRDLKEYIESYGMRWSVVESLPVVESIKYAGADRDEQIERYKESLRNLSLEGIHTICYNFMPVLDWARTDLFHDNPNGSTNLYFSFPQFAYFDIHILKREGAEADWQAKGQAMGRDILKEVEELKNKMTSEDDHKLVENIIVKTQGFVSGNIKEDDEHPVELFRQLLDLYKGISKEQLRENMRYFLNAIMPTCEECDMYMCVHPDDPPFPILGLPRIVTCDEDINWFLKAVDNKHNGDFTEASHLGGRADLIELARIFEKVNPNLPMRVDHGMCMLGDETRGYNAGYSFLGRMFAMGQVQGILATVDRELGIEYHQPGFFD